VQVFEDAIDADPEVVQAWTGLARCQKALRQFKEAAESYEAAIELEPEEPDLHLITGIIYQENLKKYQEALDHYEAYIQLGGADPVVEKWMEECREKLK
jgi:tetratricopeptide (TPR) repeat protein